MTELMTRFEPPKSEPKPEHKPVPRVERITPSLDMAKLEAEITQAAPVQRPTTATVMEQWQVTAKTLDEMAADTRALITKLHLALADADADLRLLAKASARIVEKGTIVHEMLADADRRHVAIGQLVAATQKQLDD